ncbi:MAG TPA: hypothetical protein EYQ14_13435 [Gammaproteobacteria bacterium]|nr:hypothetical protein [Gammaproteobacteria bacterium]HIL95068.1 hypothetical protein [Pseudomonadales bacterium]
MNKIRDGISSRSKALQVILASLLFFPTIAFAYVDPGSGSVIVTTILGLIAAVGYTCRKYFYKIKRKFIGKDEEKQEKS